MSVSVSVSVSVCAAGWSYRRMRLWRWWRRGMKTPTSSAASFLGGWLDQRSRPHTLKASYTSSSRPHTLVAYGLIH